MFNPHLKLRAAELDISAGGQLAVRTIRLDERSEEGVEGVSQNHPRVPVSSAAEIVDFDLVPVGFTGENQQQTVGFVFPNGDAEPLVVSNGIPMGQELSDELRVRSVTPFRLFTRLFIALACHGTFLALLLPTAQASPDAGHGLFVSASVGPLLESRQAGPLSVTGRSLAVEAGWLIPGGSILLFETGLRGEVISAIEERQLVREVAIFGGARLCLLTDPGLLELMPVVRGGFRISHQRTVNVDLEAHHFKDRFGVGPHLSIGLERELFFGTALNVALSGHSQIAPLTISLALTVSVSAQAF